MIRPFWQRVSKPCSCAHGTYTGGSVCRRRGAQPQPAESRGPGRRDGEQSHCVASPRQEVGRLVLQTSWCSLWCGCGGWEVLWMDVCKANASLPRPSEWSRGSERRPKAWQPCGGRGLLCPGSPPGPFASHPPESVWAVSTASPSCFSRCGSLRRQPLSVKTVEAP